MTIVDQLSPRMRARPVEAGFPRGIAAPSMVQLILLMMIAAFTAAYLIPAGSQSLLATADGNGPVPGEVLKYRQQVAESVAGALRNSMTRTAAELRIVANSGLLDNPDVSGALGRLTGTYHDWRGAVLLSSGGAPIAARGEQVPVLGTAPTALTVQPVIRGTDTVIVTALPLTGTRSGQVLAVSSALRLKRVEPVRGDGQRMRLIAADGTRLSRQGAADSASVAALVADAGSRAASGRGGVVVGNPAGQRVPVVAYAPVAQPDARGSLGLAVISVRSEHTQADVRPLGIGVGAGILAVLALAGFFLLRTWIVAPIGALRTDALAVANGLGGHRVLPARIRELAGLADALEWCRTRESRTSTPFVSASALVLVVTVGVLGWSAVMALTVGAQPVRPPAAVVNGQSAQLAQTSDTVRRSLTEGLAQLRAVAALSADRRPGELRAMFDQLADAHSRFRSVYLADPSGKVDVSAETTPIRAGSPLPSGAGLHQENTAGREPIVYAYVPAPGNHVLVGEYDVAALVTLMKVADTRVRMVDSAQRTVIDTQAYVAFEPITDTELSAVATSALARKPTAKVTESTIVSAAPLDTNGLRWALLGERSLGSLATQDNRTSAGARAAALLAAVVAVACCAWHFVIILRPLREISDSVRWKESGAGEGIIAAQRQDEIGTIASCFEVCRRALVDERRKVKV